MKAKLSLAALASLAVALIALVAHAFESHIGTIVSPDGGSFNQATTAVTFTIPPGAPLAIQCDAAACILAGAGSSTSASCTASASNRGVKVAADSLYDLPLVTSGGITADTVAIIPVSGTANCEVYRVVTP